MAQRQDPSLEYVAGLCRRNAVHVLKLAWTTHPQTGFDRAGVRWLSEYIERNRGALTAELTDEFVQLMGCYYGQCLIAEFGGRWDHSGGRLGIRMDQLGFTYPFAAVARQVELGEAVSVATAYEAAIKYLSKAA